MFDVLIVTAALYGLANVGLLAGIFLRLGGILARLDHLNGRLSSLEDRV